MIVTLRDILPKDKDVIREWRNLTEVAQYMYTDHLITPEEHERWFQGVVNDPERRYWIITYHGEDVGLANLYGIDEKNRRAHWAFYLASPDDRGKGIGSAVEYLILEQVFDELHFNRLCCEVLASNHSVIKMHQSFGFSQEGVFRQHVIKGGHPSDVVSLAILREEWELRRTEMGGRLKRKGLL